MAELALQFSTSSAFASAIIRRLTQSDFSHVDIVLPGEGLLGVSGKWKPPRRQFPHREPDVGGVIIRPFDAWPYMRPPKTARVQCSEEVRDRAIAWARTQLGKPFDKKALYAFLRDRVGLPAEGRPWRDPDKWYCSEMVMRALEVSGLFPYPLITPKDTVSPNIVLVHINPFMTRENILEFQSWPTETSK